VGNNNAVWVKRAKDIVQQVGFILKAPKGKAALDAECADEYQDTFLTNRDNLEW
jgi:hypothetical protein